MKWDIKKSRQTQFDIYVKAGIDRTVTSMHSLKDFISLLVNGADDNDGDVYNSDGAESDDAESDEEDSDDDEWYSDVESSDLEEDQKDDEEEDPERDAAVLAWKDLISDRGVPHTNVANSGSSHKGRTLRGNGLAPKTLKNHKLRGERERNLQVGGGILTLLQTCIDKNSSGGVVNAYIAENNIAPSVNSENKGNTTKTRTLPKKNLFLKQ